MHVEDFLQEQFESHNPFLNVFEFYKLFKTFNPKIKSSEYVVFYLLISGIVHGSSACITTPCAASGQGFVDELGDELRGLVDLLARAHDDCRAVR